MCPEPHGEFGIRPRGSACYGSTLISGPPCEVLLGTSTIAKGCTTVFGVTGEYPSQVVAHTGRPDWNQGIASSPQAASAALGVVRVAGL